MEANFRTDVVTSRINMCVCVCVYIYCIVSLQILTFTQCLHSLRSKFPYRNSNNTAGKFSSTKVYQPLLDYFYYLVLRT